MNVRLRLNSVLDEYLPLGTAGDVVEVDVSGGATPFDLMDHLGIPRHRVLVVLVDGRFVPPQRRGSLRLAAGSEVDFFPLLAGG